VKLAAMKREQALVGAGVFALGVLIGAGATQVSSEAGYSGVGPNFLPWAVGAMLALCGAWLVWESGSGGFRSMTEPSGSARGHWRGFVFVSAALLVNAALITTIGFILSCTLCFVIAVRGFRSAEARLDLSARAFVLDALIGFAIAAPVFWMFTQLLAINLPGLTSTGWL
jgi:putative tricarboxylic transport membrane protein